MTASSCFVGDGDDSVLIVVFVAVVISLILVLVKICLHIPKNLHRQPVVRLKMTRFLVKIDENMSR